MNPPTSDELACLLLRDFSLFIEASFCELNPQTPYLHSPHIDLIASKLEGVRQGKIRRLIICQPPRSLKSHCSSVALPAWYLGHHPEKKVIGVCYGQELSEKFARDTKRLMLSPWYQKLFPTTRLSDRQAAHDFATTQGGGRMATSVGGPLTGRGGDLIIIDDLIKPNDASSETQRAAVNDFLDGTLLSRLDNKNEGAIVVVMQRVHQDDPVGHLLEQQTQWDVLALPAIAETDEFHRFETPYGFRTFRRAIGEALHPARESISMLESIRADIGSYAFSAQYQQSPLPVGGAIVLPEWFRYYEPGEEPGHFSYIVQSWDTANKAAETNDFSVCLTIGVKAGQYYVLDVFRKRLTFPDLKRAVLVQAKKYSANTVVIEDKASGTGLIDELKSQANFSIRGYVPPTGCDKVTRLRIQTPKLESGKVWLPKRAAWLADYVNELTGFPGTRYDDQVDATSQALDYLQKHDRYALWERMAAMAPYVT